MKSFGFEEFGDANVFKTLELPTPELKPTQILVATHAIGVNPYEVKLRSGDTGGRPLTFPVVPGSDIVGKVVKVGEEVTDFAIGDMVIGRANLGAYSELVPVGQKRAVKLPDDLPVEVGAALPTPGVAAFDLINGATTPDAGASIAIIGASGAVGSMLVQLAKNQGLLVTAIAGAHNQTWIESLNPDHSYIYNSDALTDRFNQFDIVVNAVNHDNMDELAGQLVGNNGTIISLSGFGDALNQAEMPTVTFIDFNDGQYKQTHLALTKLVDLYENDELSVRIGQQLPFSLEGIIAAHQAIDSHKANGKLVLMNGHPLDTI